MGSNEWLVFEVKIENRGEDAFRAEFYMNVPPSMKFRSAQHISGISDTSVICLPPSASTNYTLKCSIGNPLSAGQVSNFKVTLLPPPIDAIVPKYDFFMIVNSTNVESSGSEFDNVVKKTVQITTETNLSVRGRPMDEDIFYNTTDFIPLDKASKERDIGQQVVHIYEISNQGPLTIEQAEIYFRWPFVSISGDPLLYLLNQPETTRNVQCEPTPFANTRNLELDQSLVSKSYLVSAGIIEKSELRSNGGRFSRSLSESLNRQVCKDNLCALIRCIVNDLKSDSSAWFAFRMRLVTETLNRIAPNVPFDLSTVMVSHVLRLPFIGEPIEKSVKSHEVEIHAFPIPEPQSKIELGNSEFQYLN